MVFKRGNDDLIASVYEFSTIAGGDKIDAFGGAASIDDLARFGSVDEPLDFYTRIFILTRRKLAQIMYASMHIRIFLGVVARDPVHHDLRFLGRRGVVEIDQPAPVDLLTQD